MTHRKEDAQRIAELNAAFMTLNDRDKDSALAILRTLRFAQTVTDADTYKETQNAAHQQPKRAGYIFSR